MTTHARCIMLASSKVSLCFTSLCLILAQREFCAKHTNYSLAVTAVPSNELEIDFKYILAILLIISQPEWKGGTITATDLHAVLEFHYCFETYWKPCEPIPTYSGSTTCCHDWFSLCLGQFSLTTFCIGSDYPWVHYSDQGWLSPEDVIILQTVASNRSWISTCNGLKRSIQLH